MGEGSTAVRRIERALNGSTVYTDEGKSPEIKPPPPIITTCTSAPSTREDLTHQRCQQHNWPDPKDSGRYRGVVERARRAPKKTDYGVMFVFNVNVVPVTQFMQASTSGLKTSSCGLSYRTMMRRVVDIHLAVGEGGSCPRWPCMDIVQVSDDMGTQDRLQFSPEIYREKSSSPFHREDLQRMIHDLTSNENFGSSCGF